MPVGQCALCGLTKELRESHIIPDFVGKWLKKTSATGYLRQAESPNKRIQDLLKKHLLCGDCEVLFSRYEKMFAENIFIPFQNGEKLFHYDEWLLKFIISINWRVGILELLEQKNTLPPKLKEELKKAVDIWKVYLLGNRKDVSSYKNHIFFLDILSSVSPGEEVPEHINWYFLRTTDATVAISKEIIFVYSKLPGIIQVSHIYPRNIEGWHSTRIFKRGTIKIPQSCEVPGFGEFLNHRINETNRFTSQMSDVQRKKIGDSVKKDISRLENSKSLEVFLADQKFKK